MHTQDLSIVVDEGGRSQAVAVSGSSAQSAGINADYALVTATTPVFVRQGSSPSASSSGTDIYLLSNVSYRLNLKRGNKLAFCTSGATGIVYITPGA